MNIKLPILHIHEKYILPVAKKDYGICGKESEINGFYDNVRFIDVNGQEWLIKEVINKGYINKLQYLHWNDKYRKIRVTFKLEKGKLYSLLELRDELQLFLLNKKLSGSPFHQKKKEVSKYLASFTNIEELVSNLAYFDAR